MFFFIHAKSMPSKTGVLLGKTVEGCFSTVSIAEEAYADAFPIAGTHGECIARLDETGAIGAVGELVTISLTVVVNAHPELLELTLLNDFTLALRLNENAVFTEADAMKCLATAEETGIAVARRGE